MNDTYTEEDFVSGQAHDIVAAQDRYPSAEEYRARPSTTTISREIRAGRLKLDIGPDPYPGTWAFKMG